MSDTVLHFTSAKLLLHRCMEESPQFSIALAPFTVRENIETIANLEQQFLRYRTSGYRLADGIAAFRGSLPFVAIHFVWFAIWILLNSGPWSISPRSICTRTFCSAWLSPVRPSCCGLLF